MQLRPFSATLVTLALLAGCGGASDSGGEGPERHTVTIGDDGYEPAELTISVGDRVRFVNRLANPSSAQTPGVDGAPGDGPTDHSGKDINYATKRGFATHALFPGEGQTVVFRVPRRYVYYSTFDEATKGVIVVRRRLSP